MNPLDNPLNPVTFYFHTPLYTKINITDDNRGDFKKLVNFNGKIDYYNPILNSSTTYKIDNYPLDIEIHRTSLQEIIEKRDSFLYIGGYLRTQVKCLRSDKEYAFFLFHNTENGTLQKIGQYPSIADYDISQTKKYNKILNENYLREFNKAIGLAANGVGIGSFVYLRRIFEDIIKEAYDKAKLQPDWDDIVYTNKKTGEKIDFLEDYLPETLVKNKSMYGILSKGIHELKEEECLKYFNVVKVGIELILDEKLEEYNKKKKIEEAEKAISSVNQEVKK